MARNRERILQNLETIYREAYDRAKSMDDAARMMDLDASFQREQLIMEVLLDVRDAILAITEAPSTEGALDKLKKIKDLAKLK